MNLGNFSDMFFIVVLALIIFGPKRLPEMARQLGKALSEFKRASNEFKAQLETEMRQIEIEEALRKEKDSLANAITTPPGTLESAAGNPELAIPAPAELAAEANPTGIEPPKPAAPEAQEGPHA